MNARNRSAISDAGATRITVISMANSDNAKNQAAAQDRSPAARRLEADLAATLDENQATNTRPAGIQSATDRWARRAGQIQFCFRFAAILFLACFLIGWPLGTSWAEHQLTGMFRFRLGFGLPVFLYMITVPILIFVIGYILSLGFRMAGKAEELEMSAARLYQPDAAGPQQTETAGAAVRGQIASLNSHLDEALGKLATVESMIRQQVKAIENAAAAMQDGTSSKAERVAAERQSLMELTETLNREAERFAEAIAEKAKLGLESSDAANSRIAGAERELESRLGRLEDTAGKALDAFERLAETIAEKESSIDAATARIDDATQRADEKSSHLAELMQQQQERADRLAAAIASQSEQTSTFDSAIEKLATIEGMIRTQVDAIDAAAEKIRLTSGESAQLVASEREQLIGLTEQLNQEAEQFAAALTRQAKAGIDGQADAKAQIAEAEADMKSRLGNIEQVSAGTSEVTENITAVTASAQETSHTAHEVNGAASELSVQAESLRSVVGAFLERVRTVV